MDDFFLLPHMCEAPTMKWPCAIYWHGEMSNKWYFVISCSMFSQQKSSAMSLLSEWDFLNNPHCSKSFKTGKQVILRGNVVPNHFKHYIKQIYMIHRWDTNSLSSPRSKCNWWVTPQSSKHELSSLDTVSDYTQDEFIFRSFKFYFLSVYLLC